MIQPSKPDEKEVIPEQLRWLERIQKPIQMSNSKCASVTIIEDKVQELETYKEASQNSACQKVTKEEIIILDQNQTWNR